MSTVDSVVDSLVEQIKHALGKELVGIYMYGSMVHGDFDDELSDIDLLVVIQCSIESLDLDELTKAHKKFNGLFPKWRTRLDLAYVPLESLKLFRTKRYSALTISGEQELTKTDSLSHWLIDWYKVLYQSKILYGPSPDKVIPEITKQEFRGVVKEYLLGWPNQAKLKTDPADLAFVVLAVCRSMYAYTTCENISKVEGAEWAENEFPEFSKLIRRAVPLSRSPDAISEEDSINTADVLSFVEHICSQLN